MDWQDCIADVGMMTCEDYDGYGHFIEYDIVLADEFQQQAFEQIADFLLYRRDDIIASYLRRYDDGQTRIFLMVDKTMTWDGLPFEEELKLSDRVLDALDEMELE